MHPRNVRIIFSPNEKLQISRINQGEQIHIKMNPTAEVMFEKAKYKVNKLIIQIKIFHNEENSDKIMTNGD